MARKSGKHLVIVESPAKAKTINKYLGDDYIVRASMGHVRDLPSKGMGVDLKTFQPDYEVLEEPQQGHQRTEETGQGQRRRSIWQPTWTAKGKPSPGI